MAGSCAREPFCSAGCCVAPARYFLLGPAVHCAVTPALAFSSLAPCAQAPPPPLVSTPSVHVQEAEWIAEWRGGPLHIDHVMKHFEGYVKRDQGYLRDLFQVRQARLGRG